VIPLLLLACSAGPTVTVPGPSLAPGDETVYAGEVREVSTRTGAEYRRTLRLAVRVLALDARPGGTDVAVLTQLRPMEDGHVRDAAAVVAGPSGGVEAAAATRLDLFRVDARGRVRRLLPPPGVPLRLSAGTPTAPTPEVPLDAPAAAEVGMFVPLPDAVASGGWTVPGGNRPAVAWAVGRTAVRDGAQVVELVGVQETGDWAEPTGTASPWRREDRVWVSPADGLARRFERTVERKAGVHVAYRRTVRAEAAPPAAVGGPVFEAARREIAFAWTFAADAAAARTAADAARLADRIARYRRDHDPTAYRDAVDAVQHRLEAAGR
jgi:hypothetical protein